MESESRNNGHSRGASPVMRTVGGNHGDNFDAGNKGNHIPTNMGKDPTATGGHNRGGFCARNQGNNILKTIERNVRENMDGVDRQKNHSANSRGAHSKAFQKEEVNINVASRGHVHLHVTQNGMQGHKAGGKNDSQDPGVSQQGTGTYLTVANMEHKMRSTCFAENSERRRASDST